MSKAVDLLKGVGGAIVGAIAAVIPHLFSKKKFVLWYLGRDDKWIKKSSPISHRQCRKTIKVLCSDGAYIADRFKILREGTAP